MHTQSKLCPSVVAQFKVVEDAAFEFVAKLDNTEKEFKKQALTIPKQSIKEQLADAYWAMFDVVEQFEKAHQEYELGELKVKLRAIIQPWLGRSRFFWRSYAKPHGYAGDFKIIDWMYDLEESAGNDPTEPAMVNCLDYIFSTNASVVSLWDRRRWLKRLLMDEAKRNPDLRVLDIACGGARYLKDFMDDCPESQDISLTLLDQDPAALAFAEQVNLKEYADNLKTICAPIKNLNQVVAEEYDVIISSGLFDYLDVSFGQTMLSFLSSKLNTNGLVAITNYHTNDASAVSKDWCADWPLVFKSEDEIKRMFPDNGAIHLELSPNGSLIMASWRKQ